MAIAQGAASKKYDFGLATFIIDEGKDTEIRFDGKLCEDGSYLQADGGEISLEPETEDIVLKDFSETNYDYAITGWNGTVTIAASAYTLKLMSAILSGTYTGVAEDGTVKWITDAPIGTSLREQGRTITIHPRQMGEDKTEDIHIYKAVNTSGYSRTFDNEQASHEMEFEILPKDCADANVGNNFFFIGEDPASFNEDDIYTGYFDSEDVGTNDNVIGGGTDTPVEEPVEAPVEEPTP